MHILIIVLTAMAALVVAMSLLRIASNDRVTITNVAFLRSAYAACATEQQVKIDALVQWHRQHNFPFLVERSVKIHRGTGVRNDTRFACFFHLATVMPQWREFAAILALPRAIQDLCVFEYTKNINNNNDIDLIWGVDPHTKVEKIYLEYPHRGLIRSFVLKDQQILSQYTYVKSATHSPPFAFMYTRHTPDGTVDSTHYALKQPLVLGAYNIVYLISQNSADDTYTLYYRCL